MTEKLVKLTIDGAPVEVPPGTLLVDAAKRAGVEIPVFCYHPKLDPVGMCRMCLVEVGRPGRDRATGEPLLDEDGKPLIQFGGNLETACTLPVGEGWEVRVSSPAAIAGRKQILEYLLTSHPLDCPVCDKGGECPLQELTLDHGPGESRFLYEDKQHLAKRVPLGELIWLDRERCIQCARCTRFQTNVADDPVIGFSQRGRRLEIVTFSDPGFDSYFSGNTTDICPVGALTTADFRFGARPWELNAAASICPHCPVGCNLTLNTRREAQAGGDPVIKRVMPRQNESVNEIWICDKGRFAHHFARSPARLITPLVRSNGKLKPASWKKAMQRAAEGLKAASGSVLGLVGGRLSNEDYFTLARLIEGLGGTAGLASSMAGGDLVRQVGLASGSNLGALGKGDAVLVIAADLHEEAPVWWLRLKQASERGVAIVVASPRITRLDKFARRILRYSYGRTAATALALLEAATGDPTLKAHAGDREIGEVARLLAQADNLLIFYGGEGTDLRESQALASACARLLIATGHSGRANNGLIPVWHAGNLQGAWELGWRPIQSGPAQALKAASAAYIVGADPAGDDPAALEALEGLSFLVVQELFLTETAQRADVVFPAQSFVEREGSYTSAERRVQRFYPAVIPLPDCQPDWQIASQLGELLEIDVPTGGAAQIFQALAGQHPGYAGLSFRRLAEVEPQWPLVGERDLYFGGTSYRNSQGLGIQLAPEVELGAAPELPPVKPPEPGPQAELLLVPISKLYDLGVTLAASQVLHPRIAPLQLWLNPQDAERLKLQGGALALMSWDGRAEQLPVAVDPAVPAGAALLPRSLGVALADPVPIELQAVESRR